MTESTDLTVEAFLTLRNRFFDADLEPIPFNLRPKRNTQDDPFDEFLAKILDEEIDDVVCIKAPGPLITPDMALIRVDACKDSISEKFQTDLTKIVGIEVKKLERTSRGSVSRATGLDYNTTPPCGTIRVYQKDSQPINIRGFYLFVCLESAPSESEKQIITALVLCDGNILNADFDYYLSVVGEREKLIGLGTYKDGADRCRPMVIFANPLGAEELDHQVSLIHENIQLEKSHPNLCHLYTLRRNFDNFKYRDFYCFRFQDDVASTWDVKVLVDPFPTPRRRGTATQKRGMFRLPF